MRTRHNGSFPRWSYHLSRCVRRTGGCSLAIAAVAATADRTAWYAPVAACGRTLTETQLAQILARHHRAPVLAADDDTPGRNANIQWATAALKHGRGTVIVQWPDDQDPASWLAQHHSFGLLAVTRKGCLTATAGEIRPRHVGKVLTESAVEAAVSGSEASEARERLLELSSGLPAPARFRFARAARLGTDGNAAEARSASSRLRIASPHGREAHTESPRTGLRTGVQP